MKTFDDVFAAFQGPARFAEAVGITAVHAQTMKTRSSIPSLYWIRVVGAARERGIEGITLEALAELAAAKTPFAPGEKGGVATKHEHAS